VISESVVFGFYVIYRYRFPSPSLPPFQQKNEKLGDVVTLKKVFGTTL